MNKSEQINELATALSKAQGQIKPAAKDSTNPFYKSKYADLASVWEACRKPLTDNGLSVVQTIEGMNLETILLHTSGQYIGSSLSITSKEPTSQAIGSAITYARRYALSAMVGICSEDDDDGEAAMARDSTSAKVVPAKVAPAKPAPAKVAEGDKLTEEQSKRIYAIVKEKGITPDQAKLYIKVTFNKSAVKELTSDEARRFIEDMESGKIVPLKMTEPLVPRLVETALKLGAEISNEGGK